MRPPVMLVMLVLALAACGGEDDRDPGSAATGNPSTSSGATENSGPEEESTDCLVAASKWADRMTSHVLDASTTAPGLAEMLDLADIEDPSSEIKVLCSDAIEKPVLNANLALAKANYELSLCAVNPDDTGFGPTCPEPKAKQVRKLADNAAKLVGQVRRQLP